MCRPTFPPRTVIIIMTIALQTIFNNLYYVILLLLSFNLNICIIIVLFNLLVLFFYLFIIIIKVIFILYNYECQPQNNLHNENSYIVAITSVRY